VDARGHRQPLRAARRGGVRRAAGSSSLADGSVAISCNRERRTTSGVPGCSGATVALCDFPLQGRLAGATRSKPLCDADRTLRASPRKPVRASAVTAAALDRNAPTLHLDERRLPTPAKRATLPRWTSRVQIPSPAPLSARIRLRTGVTRLHAASAKPCEGRAAVVASRSASVARDTFCRLALHPVLRIPCGAASLAGLGDRRCSLGVDGAARPNAEATMG
jgi:hypothetical protein